MARNLNLVNFFKKTNLISIEDGQKIYNEILNEVKSKNEIIIDFSGVENCVSRFLNPAIGELYEVCTSEELNQYLKFKNLSVNMTSKINTVIKNAKNFYNDPQRYIKTVEEVENNA